MHLRIEAFTTLLILTFLLFSISYFIGCDKASETPLAENGERPPPKGETHLTGHYLPVPPDNKDVKTWWRRTAQIEKYDKRGIPKHIPRDEAGNSYLTTDHLPPHLRQRYEAVIANGNTPDINPDYYEEMYNALCGDLKPKDAVKFFITYNMYNAVAVKHMDDYQAFQYILRTTEGVVSASEYAQRIFKKKPKSRLGYEAGMYLRRYSEVITYHPKDSKALDRYAMQFYNQQDYEEALKYFTRASQQNNVAVRHYRMSICYDFLKDTEKSLFHIKQALQFDPTYQDYIAHLVCEESGRQWDPEDVGLQKAFNAYYLEAYNEIGRAINEIKQAIVHDPNEPVWQRKLSELKK